MGSTVDTAVHMSENCHISDTCTAVSTVLHIVSVWDPRMHYKFLYIESVLWKA